MSYGDLPIRELFLERDHIDMVQQMIDNHRYNNPTDAYLQLVMDRQQEKLNRQWTAFEEAIAEIAINN